MLLQIVDSVAKEEIVVGSCAVGDLIENNNATFAVEDHKSMEKQLSLSCGVTEYEDECEEKNKSDWNDSYNLELTLHSPVGGESLIYKWPLVLGDERDESLEILETIRWACRDTPELESMLGRNEFHSMYDPRSYQGMKKLCDRYNGAVNTLRQLKWITEKSPPTPSSSSSSTTYQFASTGLLKHILQVCYNRAVEDPDKLNQYEPFSPEVYGETSFELVEELTKVTKFGEDDVFIDLGSGVGQVVLQIASSTPCKFCYGIEKSDWPAKYSESLSSEFKKLMSFFGKYHGMFRLEKGDFLAEDKVEIINSASIIFVNNFAFGPQVDHQLKLRFANVKEGARIVSSRAFCPLNFHITDRNLSDIGTIMKVEELTALPAAVSWTDKPFAYFLHTIDRSLLEKYFNNLKTNSETGTRRVVGNERNKRKFINGGSVKSESGDDAVKNKKPRKQLNGETDSGVETIGNQENKMKTLDQMLVCDKRKYKLKLKKGPKKGFTVKRGRKKLNSNTLNTLDMFHRQISSGSNSFDEPSKGIFNDHWMLPQQTREDQITTSHLHGAVGPLKNLMAVFERQMMFFLQHMQTSTFKDNLRKEVEFEQKRNSILSSKISNLKMEVQLLRKQGSDIIERKMNEASPKKKKNISDLLNETNSVMASKTNLERQVSHLKEQVTQLEHEQKQITNFQPSRNDGNLPTLHDLLASPMNAPPRLTAASSAYRTFHQVKDQPEANNLLLDLTEMLVRKNLQSGLPVEPSSKKPIKRSRTSNCSETGTDPIHKHPRKKAKSMEDNNNNSTLLPSSNQFDSKDQMKLMQQQTSGEQQKLTSRQQKHRSQTNQLNKHAIMPMNVPSDIHPQVLHQQQIMRQHQLDQQKLKLHAQQLPSLHHSKNLQSSCERLPVAQEQQLNGHFPYKLVSNETARHSSPLNLPPSFEDPNKTSIDKITPQAPFISKLAAPNFAVVDFSQLIKSGGMPQPLISTKHLPLELPPSSFPLPPHIFPPPNFMLLKPPMGSTPLMSPLSKPLFSSFPTSSVEVPSASFGNTSFISFSSPLLSLPLFQPTNLISTSMACTSKLSKSHSSSAINSASSPVPLSKDQSIKISPEPAAATTSNKSHESSTRPNLETLDVVHVKEDGNISLDDSTPLKSSSGKLLEGHSCKGEKIGINEFTDNRKEVLASQ